MSEDLNINPLQILTTPNDNSISVQNARDHMIAYSKYITTKLINAPKPHPYLESQWKKAHQLSLHSLKELDDIVSQ